MASTGAASAITLGNDKLDTEFNKDFEVELKVQSEQKLQEVLKESEETKQTTLDAVIKDLGSEIRLEFGKTNFQQPANKVKDSKVKDNKVAVSQEFSAADISEHRTHSSTHVTPQIVLESLEQTMPPASFKKLIITEDALEVDSDVGQESYNGLYNSLTRSIPSVPTAVAHSDTKLSFTTVARTETQRLQSLMQEFKQLLDQYQQQTLNLAESYATIADHKAASKKTDLDLTNLGSVAIQQHDIDSYQSGLAQLTHTLNSMESELEAALRKAEYQELSRQDLEAAHLEMLERLANTSEIRCDVPNIAATRKKDKHLDRVGELCAKIAQTLGCDEDFVNKIALSARLHDIGKLAIPDTILQKPDRLDADEYTTMKMHTIHGAEMLANNSSEIVQMAQRIALTHHENWDGSGYPYQLERKEIVLEGRIAAVADVYDALISSRIYKEAWPKEKAIEQIKSRSGTKFDPVIVEAFLKVVA